MFSDDDVKFLTEFGAFLKNKVRITDMTFDEVLQVHRYLVSYNKIVKKVHDNVLELNGVTTEGSGDAVG